MNTSKASNQKIKVGFFADGSIKSPVLHSQGIPLFNYLAEKNYSAFFITLEEKNENNETFIQTIRKLESEKLKFLPVYLSTKKIIPNWLIYFTEGLCKVKSLIKKNNIEIIHTRSFFPTIISYIIKTFFYKKLKIVYDTRGVFIEERIFLGHWKNNSLKTKLFRRIENKLIKESDFIVVVSEVHKAIIEANYKNNSIRNKIKVITNRLDINPISGNKVQKKNQEFYIGVFSGSSARWQSLPEVFRLMEIALNDFDIFKFRVLTYEPEQFQLLNKNKVCEIEIISPENVHEKLSLCNFGILIREQNLINKVASPLKFAEYLRAGLPVLISEGIGDTEKIIKKYDVGVIIKNDNYANALNDMLKLLRNPEIYLRCQEAVIKEFNQIDSFKSYEDIYNQIIRKKK
jgi:glycosyltransferase involved in cell wall biosynthesis